MRYGEVCKTRIFKWTLARKGEKWAKFICLRAENNLKTVNNVMSIRHA